MRNPEFVREYDALAPEFAVAGQLIRARTQAEMSQANVGRKNAGHTIRRIAKRMEGGINVVLSRRCTATP